MLIIETQENNVYRNLAVEEYLLERGEEGPFLFLYRNCPAVVIGKNQNPWRECRIDCLHDIGAALARRISGGGAVYHDLGNLNYSLVCARSLYRAEEVFARVLAALRNLGIRARLEGKTSLTVDGRKISGNAFAFRRKAVLHHGTLLVSANLDLLRSLFPGDLSLEDGYAVASVPADTINLHDLRSGLSWREVGDALAEQFVRYYGPARRVEDTEIETWPWRAFMTRLSERAWVYGRTPPFTVVLPDGWRLRVEEGVVRSVRSPEGMESAVKSHAHLASWVGRPFEEVVDHVYAMGHNCGAFR